MESAARFERSGKRISSVHVRLFLRDNGGHCGDWIVKLKTVNNVKSDCRGGRRKSNLPDELSSSYQKLISSSAPCMIVANMVEGIVCQVRDWQRTIETDWEIGRSYMTVFDSMHGVFEICQSERE